MEEGPQLARREKERQVRGLGRQTPGQDTATATASGGRELTTGAAVWGAAPAGGAASRLHLSSPERSCRETRIAGKRVRFISPWHSGGKHTGVDQSLRPHRAAARNEPRELASCCKHRITLQPAGRQLPPGHLRKEQEGLCLARLHILLVPPRGCSMDAWRALRVGSGQQWLRTFARRTSHRMLRWQVVPNSTTAAMQRAKHAPDSCCEKLVGSGERRAGCCSGIESPSLPAVAAYLQ